MIYALSQHFLIVDQLCSLITFQNMLISISNTVPLKVPE